MNRETKAPSQGEVPAISALVRVQESWSSYTEGWNDALDLAEQVAARAIAEIEDEYRRMLWIVASKYGGRIHITDQELVSVPRLPALTVIKDATARRTEIVAEGSEEEPQGDQEHVHAWTTDGVAAGKKLCVTCRRRTFL